jgi:hypothetical protein
MLIEILPVALGYPFDRDQITALAIAVVIPLPPLFPDRLSPANFPVLAFPLKYPDPPKVVFGLSEVDVVTLAIALLCLNIGVTKHYIPLFHRSAIAIFVAIAQGAWVSLA